MLHFNNIIINLLLLLLLLPSLTS